jgi:ABC-type transport system involved in multi-copper enzyme maturation permease subunit
VKALLAAELFKQRSTRTNLTLFLTMVGFVLFAVLLHSLSLDSANLSSSSEQMMRVFGWSVLGAMFAGMAGAMSITSEFRHGTIRPTFLVTPRRGRVVAAKAGASMLTGLVYGFVTEAVAVAAGSIALAGRGIDIKLDGGDVALLLAGGAAVGMLWALIGLGVGAVTRNQVVTLVGLAVWLLFVENLLVVYVPDVGRLAPGAAGAATVGQDRDTLLAPAAGVLLLAAYAAAALARGWRTTLRRDVP